MKNLYRNTAADLTYLCQQKRNGRMAINVSKSMKSLLGALLVIALVSANFAAFNANAASAGALKINEVTIKQSAVQGKLSFTLNAENHDSYDVKVTNLYGKTVYSKNLAKTTTAFSVQNLHPSVYTITVTAKSGTSQETKTAKIDLGIKEMNKDYANKFADLKGLNSDRINSVRWLYRFGVTAGFAGTNDYKPKNTVNRGAMAQFMHKLVGSVATDKKAVNVKDIANLGADRQEDIKWLAAEGITVLTDGKYNPANAVNRGAMAEFMYKLAGKPAPEPTSQDYAKIKDISTLSKDRQMAIAWLAKNNITVLDNGKYNPKNPVNRGAMAQFMQKLYDYVLVPKAKMAGTETYSYFATGYTPGSGTGGSGTGGGTNPGDGSGTNPGDGGTGGGTGGSGTGGGTNPGDAGGGTSGGGTGGGTNPGDGGSGTNPGDGGTGGGTSGGGTNPGDAGGGTSDGGTGGGTVTEYKVAFHVDGNLYMERTVKSGDLIGTAGITEPSKNDYVFGGWHTDVNDATSEWRLDKDAVTSDLVLNALWKKVEYDVEFYKDPNDLYIKQKATSGDLITNIVPPTKQDYKFAGWYIDVNDPNSEWRLDKDKVTAKTVLTAKWERIKYTATFNLETGMLYTAVPVDSGDTVTAFANPQKANYDFLGWFIDNNASTEAWRFGTDKVTSDITLTARWKKTEYKVELYSDTNVPYANKSVTTGSVVGVIQEPVKEYFKFDGWYTNELMPRQWDLHTHPVTSDLVLLAHWTRLTYTVTVDPRNGEKVSGGLMPAGLPLNPSENITDPTHNTDKFLGWYYMLGANERIWDMDTSIVVRNVNIYAKWSSASHVVTFESNGGSSVPSEGLNAGDLVTKVQDPTKNHADFAGWYLDRGLTKKWDFDADTVRGDMTLYAAWTPKKYTVTYVFDNGTQDATDTVTAETKIAKQPVTPTKQGYTFAGWYSDAPTFAKGWVFATDTVINDTVLTAKWDSEVFDVSFDSNGGSFVHGQRVKVGEKVATFTDPTLKGYKFAGWFYGANLDTEWDFANDTVTSDILLTAKWERMTRTVKFNTNGGTNIDQQEVTLNEAVADPGTQSKTKAIFLGWFTDPAFTAPWDFASDTVKDDMTLYVKWLEHLKFTFDGPAVSEAKLHSTWTFTKKDACQYSVDGTNYLSFSAKTLKFAPTNTLYFKGDCRDTNGRLDYMFADTFSAYTGNVKVSGGVVPLMDGIAPIETKDYQFRHMFRHDNISEISAEMFYEVYGVPKPELFKNVFYQNKLTSIPDGLFADIGGTPAREAFSGAFGLNPTLEKIGDLGMNITASSSLESVYKDMFKDAGTAASVTKITVPAGGLIEIFTNAPSSFKSLADLYTATRTNGAFSGTGWVNKYADYGSVSSNWR